MRNIKDLELTFIQNVRIKNFIEEKSNLGWKFKDFCTFAEIDFNELLIISRSEGIRQAINQLEDALDKKMVNNI